MVQTLAITEAVTTLAKVKEKFNLRAAIAPQFFQEWQQDLPELLPSEIA